MADADAPRGAGEAPGGDQRHLVAHALAVDRRGGGQHFAHAGAALGARVADDDDLAFLVVALVDRLVSVLLAVEHAGGSAELLLLHAGHLHDGAFRTSEEHTSELPSLMRHSYAVLCLQKNN